jgi:hypothetical protein
MEASAPDNVKSVALLSKDGCDSVLRERFHKGVVDFAPYFFNEAGTFLRTFHAGLEAVEYGERTLNRLDDVEQADFFRFAGETESARSSAYG